MYSNFPLLQVKTDSEGMRSDFYYEFLGVLDEVLLPALSVLDANPCLAEEIWEVLKVYPYQHRYVDTEVFGHLSDNLQCYQLFYYYYLIFVLFITFIIFPCFVKFYL